MEKDMVYNPPHYTQGNIECWHVIEFAVKELKGMEAVYVANIIKYVWRYNVKGGYEDISKAMAYMRKLFDMLLEVQNEFGARYKEDNLVKLSDIGYVKPKKELDLTVADCIEAAIFDKSGVESYYVGAVIHNLIIYKSEDGFRFVSNALLFLNMFCHHLMDKNKSLSE